MKRLETGTLSKTIELEWEPSAPDAPLSDAPPEGWSRLVLNFRPGLTNREIMDVVFAELARFINDRGGRDGSEDDPQ